MRHFIMILLLCFSLTGCSLLPKITFDKPGVTPTSTEKSNKNVRCAGELKLAEDGTVLYCSKGYYNNEQNYKQAERKFTLQERIANFIRNLTGWGFWILVLLCVFTPFGGAIVGGILNNIYGIGARGMKMLVTGIQNGKKYVRENGTKYTETERVIYNQGANDMLTAIAAETTDLKVKKQIALLRAEVD